MRKMVTFAALVLALVAGLVTAQSGQSPMLVQYSASADPTGVCFAGYTWYNVSTQHLWLCNQRANPPSWVDISSAAGGLVPIPDGSFVAPGLPFANEADAGLGRVSGTKYFFDNGATGTVYVALNADGALPASIGIEDSSGTAITVHSQNKISQYLGTGGSGAEWNTFTTASYAVKGVSGTMTITETANAATGLGSFSASDSGTGLTAGLSFNNNAGPHGTLIYANTATEFSSLAVAPTEQQAFLTDGGTTTFVVAGLVGFQDFIDDGTNTINIVSTIANPDIVTTVTDGADTMVMQHQPDEYILTATSGTRTNVITEDAFAFDASLSNGAITGSLTVTQTSFNSSFVNGTNSGGIAFSSSTPQMTLRVDGGATETVVTHDISSWVSSSTDGSITSDLRVGPTGPWDNNSGSKPTCDASTQRRRWFVAGGAGVADTYEICMKNAGDAFAWVALATP